MITTFCLMLDTDVFGTAECVWFRFDGLGSLAFTDSYESGTEFATRQELFDAMAALKPARLRFLEGRQMYAVTLEDGILTERVPFDRFFSDADIMVMADVFRQVHQVAQRHTAPVNVTAEMQANHNSDLAAFCTDDDAGYEFTE